jgi:hypothetical protein
VADDACARYAAIEARVQAAAKGGAAAGSCMSTSTRSWLRAMMAAWTGPRRRKQCD